MRVFCLLSTERHLALFGFSYPLLMIAQRCDVIVDSETSTAPPRSELCAESKEAQEAQDDS